MSSGILRVVAVVEWLTWLFVDVANIWEWGRTLRKPRYNYSTTPDGDDYKASQSGQVYAIYVKVTSYMYMEWD